MVKILGKNYKLGLKVGPERRWLLRPASKASTIGAYVLALTALLLHFL
ncbi:MAG: hypothetical protein AAF245_12045 [Pseudomonadota bacterium]